MVLLTEPTFGAGTDGGGMDGGIDPETIALAAGALALGTVLLGMILPWLIGGVTGPEHPGDGSVAARARPRRTSRVLHPVPG